MTTKPNPNLPNGPHVLTAKRQTVDVHGSLSEPADRIRFMRLKWDT